jgi:Ni/Co efflux regulator RcnB
MKKTMRSIAAVTILLSSSAIAQTAPTVQTASLKLETRHFSWDNIRNFRRPVIRVRTPGLLPLSSPH